MLYKYSLASFLDRDAVHLFGLPVFVLCLPSALELAVEGTMEYFVEGGVTVSSSDMVEALYPLSPLQAPKLCLFNEKPAVRVTRARHLEA
jgi:hypothetical protein